ncbi:RNA polymerase sigma factor SigF [Streptomyces sp. NPDC008238]
MTVAQVADRLVAGPGPQSVVEGTSTAELRQVSTALFARLAVLEEGTEEYQYVRNTLIEMNTSLVRFAARRFSQRSEQMEDILQVGTIGLIKAIDRFDPDYGAEFVTFAVPTIVGEMKRFFRDTSWSVHVPRRLQEWRIDVAKASDALAAELGRDPTVTELAEHLDLGEHDVREALVAANAYSAASLDAPPPQESAGSGTAWTDRFGYEESRYGKVEDLHALKPLLSELPERDRRIIDMRFGQEMTQAQIGRELGVSQMHVSRLLSRILTRLRAQLVPQD